MSKIPGIQSRRAHLEGRPDGRRMAAALSSDAPVRQPFGTEVLAHTAKAIDMSRAAQGLPLLINHESRDLPIGRVENIRLDAAANKLRGELVFSEATEAARDAFALVDDGTLTDVSIRYQVLDWERGAEKDEVTVTRWLPVEASVVSVPADAGVGIGRTLDAPAGEATMPDSTVDTAGAVPAAPATDLTIIDTIKERSTRGFEAGRKAEGERLNAINDLANSIMRSLPDLSADMEALASHCREDTSITAEQFRSHTLELIGGAGHPLAVDQAMRGEGGPSILQVRQPSQPLSSEPSRGARFEPFRAPSDQRRPLIQAGATGLEQACRGMELAMLERAGAELKPEEREGNQYRGWSMLDMARDALELTGVNVRGMSSEQIARAAIGMGRQRAISPGTAAYETSDFPAVTENVMTKRVHAAFMAAETTWATWCSTTEVPDFKQFTIPRLSQINSLPLVAENAAYVNLTQADAKEAATLVKQGGLISFSWEAIVNDDQRMFSTTAFNLGTAAGRTLDEKAYGVLTTNGNMGDTNPLFDALHDNIGAAALDLPGIVATRTAIARQTDDNAQALGITLRYIIVPEELRDAADNLAGSEYLPWDSPGSVTDAVTPADNTVGGSQRINTVRGTFTVVPTVRLTNVTDWFGAAGMGTVELAFLNGNRSPAILREEGWDTDAMHWKIRHPSVAYAVDWRGLYFNDVA